MKNATSFNILLSSILLLSTPCFAELRDEIDNLASEIKIEEGDIDKAAAENLIQKISDNFKALVDKFNEHGSDNNWKLFISTAEQLVSALQQLGQKIISSTTIDVPNKTPIIKTLMGSIEQAKKSENDGFITTILIKMDSLPAAKKYGKPDEWAKRIRNSLATIHLFCTTFLTKAEAAAEKARIAELEKQLQEANKAKTKAEEEKAALEAAKATEKADATHDAAPPPPAPPAPDPALQKELADAKAENNTLKAQITEKATAAEQANQRAEEEKKRADTEVAAHQDTVSKIKTITQEVAAWPVGS